MGNRPTPMEITTAIVPIIPQDIIDEILDHLATDAGFRSLRTCALVSKSWAPSCRRHLFHTIDFTSKNMDRWLKTFPIPDQSPAHDVRDLRIWIRRIPEKLLEHTVHFKNVHRVSLVGLGIAPGFQFPSLWRLPQSVTSLTIVAGAITLAEIRNIMAQLPNLDDLSLPGPLGPVDRSELLGNGTDLRGRFGGKLILRNVRYANRYIVNMLLEIPTGLRFTEVNIHCARESLHSIVTLVGACCKTIVKLSHTVNFYGKFHPFSLSG